MEMLVEVQVEVQVEMEMKVEVLVELVVWVEVQVGMEVVPPQCCVLLPSEPEHLAAERDVPGRLPRRLRLHDPAGQEEDQGVQQHQLLLAHL